MIDISIVIPTYNRNDLLEKCLMSLNFETQQSYNYEIIVSDDSLNFEAKKLIDDKYQWVTWLEGPHKGPAANRNNGAKKALGKWIVFIDDDCIPDKGLLKSYINAIDNNPDILVFEGCIKADRPKRHFLEESPVNEVGGCFWSANIMIKRDYFINILHGFDEEFPCPAMEDMDLYERIKRNNQFILFVKEAFVIHPWRLISGDEILNITKQRYLSYKYFCLKHQDINRKISFSRKIKNELRFYIKNVLFKIIPYRGKGLFTYLKLHIVWNRFESNETVKKK
jgi:GT2 family glycosyltransferase